jgi:hypothetical protein
MLTPGIHFACAFGSVEMVEMFIEAGADPLSITEDEKQSCLHRVAEHGGDIDVVKLLLRLKVPVDHPDYNGFTPLHFACWKEKATLAEVLLDAGADIEWETDMGASPLLTAVYHRSRACAALLLDRGADINAQMKEKMTPLDAARLKKDSWLVVELLERGAVSGMLKDARKPNFDMMMGKSGGLFSDMYRTKPVLPEGTLKLSEHDFVQLPAFNDFAMLIKYREANPEYSLESGSKLVEKMIQVAVHCQSLSILAYFLEAGISLDGDGDDRSPLMNAVQYGYAGPTHSCFSVSTL